MDKNSKVSSSISLLLSSLLIGLFSGSIAVFYRFLLSKLDIIRNIIYSNSNIFISILIVIVAFLLGIIVSKLLKWAPLSGGSGIPQVQGEIIGAFNQNSFRVSVSKLFGGAIASLVGLSLGREGPSIQLGATSAKWLSEKLGKDKTEEKVFLTAGAAAGLTAAFSAPISGLVFILEELHKSFSKKVVAMSFLAAVVADIIAGWVFKIKPVFSFEMNHVVPIKYYILLIPMLIITCLFGKIFNFLIIYLQNRFKKIKFGQDYKIATYFAFVALVGLTYKSILGGGHSLIENIVSNNNYSLLFLMLLLICKLIMTVSSYATGSQGGIFLPVLVIGGLSGLAYFNVCFKFGLIEKIYLSNFVVLSMVAMLTAVVRSPLLSVVLILELNGNMIHLLGLAFSSILSYFICLALDFDPIYDSLLENLLNNNVTDKNINNNFTMFEIKLGYNNKVANKKLMDINFPENALIVEIDSLGHKIVPNGSTILQTGDIITVLVKDEQLYKTRMNVLDILGEKEE